MPRHRELKITLKPLPLIMCVALGLWLGAMAIAVSNAGGLGSLPCATLSLEQIRAAQRGQGSLYAIPEVVASPLIQRLRTQQSEIAARQASIGQSRLEANPAVVALRAEEREVRTRIDDEVDELAEDEEESTQARLKSKWTALEKVVGAQPRVDSVAADLVFLQEIHGTHEGHPQRYSNWPNMPQYEFLADSLWPQFAYGRNAVYPDGHHGNALLSKYPIREYRNLDVSITGPERRGLLHCVLEVPGQGQVHAVCVHLSLLESHRQKQLQLLRKSR